MRDAFCQLGGVLKAHAGRGPVYYYPNPGNWGDAMIRHGTLKFFRDIGLKFKELRRHRKYWYIPRLRGGTVIYGGGGAWCDTYRDGAAWVRQAARRFRVIVLPSTYEFAIDIPGVTFFCRDRYESQSRMPEAKFCHDLAFYLGQEFAVPTATAGVGYFFRTDAEASGKIEIPEDNYDISMDGCHRAEARPFYRYLGQYDTIHTDRLHVAIAGTLLGRKVHLYPSAYFKNRAVYESSMQGRFENVTFHETFEPVSA